MTPMFFELSTSDIQLKFKVLLLDGISTSKGLFPPLWLHVYLDGALRFLPQLTYPGP